LEYEEEMSRYKVGSLFAGVGGICQAFRDASCDVIWANENDKNSCKTYKLNYTNTNLIETDIRDLTKDDFESIDILTAGFPCQPFSQAGHGRGFEDERGRLFDDLIRLLKDLKPKAYLLENVKTLATHNEGKSFDYVREELTGAGYSFIPFVLKAHEHTEIPQGRERIYIVGFRGESEYFFYKPVKINTQMNFADASCSSSFRIPVPSEKKLKNIKEFLECSTVDDSDYYDKTDSKIHQTVRESVIDENKFYQFRRWYVRENKSNVCPTLTANMGSGGHNIPIILDGETPRRLTPKECFNLQGFPKGFKLPDDVPRGQLYKQSGNSVVVPMIRKIAEEIIKVLDENPNC
jgi:DNA (cytosine-5)-methyltransferase 1